MFDYYKKPFSINDVQEMLRTGRAINGNNGGLAIGQSHELGGIKFLVKSDYQYLLEGELEGYEYILNPGATYYFSKNFDHFNNNEKHASRKFDEYQVPDFITILNCKKECLVEYLIFDFGGFGIINKHSTKGYLITLEKMNNSISYSVINSDALKIINNHIENIDIFFYENYEGYLPPLPAYKRS